ncbi:MAG: hypothetical protein AAFY28_12475, partial [Actinomycetota bacterium]
MTTVSTNPVDDAGSTRAVAAAAAGALTMLDGRSGVSVVDPVTPLSRVWYFDGKFLRAEHFRHDQGYIRALTELSNRALGHGVVEGFEATLGAGDSLEVAGGLAVAQSGRVIHLPGAVSMSIDQLIQRSAAFPSSTRKAAGRPGFDRCPPDETDDRPDTVTAPRPAYLLTVSSAEALCGEEERFGELCVDACATETDRSFAVEGAVFRVAQLDLAYPELGVTIDDRTSLRSRVASAYYERERSIVGSRISGAGLRTSVWCSGATGVDGEEVPLAVFDRSGNVTSWVDNWIARRELVEQSPRRYWGWRMAMRPLDVFLAQVLQFQCQLLGVTPDGPSVAPGDPCADERAVLAEAGELLTALLRGPAQPEAAARRVGGVLGWAPNAGRGEFEESSGIAATRFAELRERISGALSGGGLVSPTGSILLDRGFVDVPSAGYLPIDETRPLVPQVRAMFGPGVDLRFCAVRPDFVPEALQEAQHMERISLTSGIADPESIEEVDVLVPGGTVSTQTTEIDALEGVIRILPSSKSKRPEAEVAPEFGSAVTLSAVARDDDSDGWSWSLAAHGEAPHRLAVAQLFGLVANDVIAEAEAASAEDASVHIEADAVHDDDLKSAAFKQRANREAVFARERAESAVFEAIDNPKFTLRPDRAIPDDEKRPVAMWFDVDLAKDLTDTQRGERVAIRGRTSLYSRARSSPVVIDAQVSGDLIVLRTEQNSLGRQRYLTVVTGTDVVVDTLVLSGPITLDRPPQRRTDVELTWKIGVGADAGRLLSVSARRGTLVATAEFRDFGSPRVVEGAVDLARRGPERLKAKGDWSTIHAHREGGEFLRVAATKLVESPGALDVGRSGRDLAENVIDVIGSELGVRGRDPSFVPAARERMFAAAPAVDGEIVAGSDWVMFHRRRVKDCGRSVERPPALRTVRWYHG